MSKALVVFSGGLDSTTLLYYAIKHFDEVETLSFTYGSKHNDIEHYYALKTCEKLNIKNTLISLDFISQYFKSDLLKSGGDIPEGMYNEENMKSTVVPFRNGIMLAIAAGFAESNDIDVLLLGNHSGDHAIYPDCRPEFIANIAGAIRDGTEKRIQVISPFCDMSKTDIVKLGAELGVDFSLTYSCYKGGKKHCGKCGTCTERKESFEQAGVKDPTEYEE
jgi:7-cyano-7-deazaguanine synthase